jgi:8-oxo-dGTP pyrophosphatase MutT (NUDIX family)
MKDQAPTNRRRRAQKKTATGKKPRAPRPAAKAPPAPPPAPPPYRQAQNGAFIIFLDPEQRFLVGRMSYKPGKPFTLPGGGVERGEPYDVAALIEAHEEAGIFRTAYDLRIVGAMAQRIPSDAHLAGTLVVFECQLPASYTLKGDGELEDLQLMSIDEALDRAEEFSRPMLRLLWLAHAVRNAKNGPTYFSANMTSPVWARRGDGQFVAI